MNWKNISAETPNPEKMVLVRTINQPIVQYVVASWDESCKVWIDYDDVSFAGNWWAEITEHP